MCPRLTTSKGMTLGSLLMITSIAVSSSGGITSWAGSIKNSLTYCMMRTSFSTSRLKPANGATPGLSPSTTRCSWLAEMSCNRHKTWTFSSSSSWTSVACFGWPGLLVRSPCSSTRWTSSQTGTKMKLTRLIQPWKMLNWRWCCRMTLGTTFSRSRVPWHSSRKWMISFSKFLTLYASPCSVSSSPKFCKTKTWRSKTR